MFTITQRVARQATSLRALSSSTRAVCAAPHAARRAFSSSPTARGPQPLTILIEEEEAIRDMVRRFATDVVGPKVREMDENEMMDPEVIKGLFEQGVCGFASAHIHNNASHTNLAAHGH